MATKTPKKTEIKVDNVFREDDWGDEIPAQRVTARGNTFEITTQVISPSTAEAWLERNVANPRQLRVKTWKRYAEDMIADAWAVPTGFIGFDTDNNLVNGQHTLSACADSGRSIVSVVIYGVPLPAIEAMDRGMKRALADTFHGRGFLNPRDLQSAVNVSWKWDRGRLTARNRPPTDHQALTWFEANPGLADCIQEAWPLRKVGMRVSVVAPLLYRAMRIDPDAAGELIEKAVTGVGLDEGDPILAWKASVLNKFKRKDSQVYALALAVKVWNARVQGQQLTLLKWAREANERFPQMVDVDGKVVHFPGTAEQQDIDLPKQPRGAEKIAALLAK